MTWHPTMSLSVGSGFKIISAYFFSLFLREFKKSGILTENSELHVAKAAATAEIAAGITCSV